MKIEAFTLSGRRMGEIHKNKTNLVEQYLHIVCFNKISDSIFRDMLDYEAKADPIEKKLIKRIRHQVEHGKVLLSYSESKKL